MDNVDDYKDNEDDDDDGAWVYYYTHIAGKSVTLVSLCMFSFH